jgi:hypothetical protein
MNDQRVVLTDADLSAFVQKMAAFSESLSSKEQAFLNQLLADAADAANLDVSGYVDLHSLLDDDDVQGLGIVPDEAREMTTSLAAYRRGLAREDAETVGSFDTDE